MDTLKQLESMYQNLDATFEVGAWASYTTESGMQTAHIIKRIEVRSSDDPIFHPVISVGITACGRSTNDLQTWPKGKDGEPLKMTKCRNCQRTDPDREVPLALTMVEQAEQIKAARDSISADERRVREAHYHEQRKARHLRALQRKHEQENRAMWQRFRGKLSKMILEAVEEYYEQGGKDPGRFFHKGDDYYDERSRYRTFRKNG